MQFGTLLSCKPTVRLEPPRGHLGGLGPPGPGGRGPGAGGRAWGREPGAGGRGPGQGAGSRGRRPEAVGCKVAMLPTPFPRYIGCGSASGDFYCFVELLALPTETPRLFEKPDVRLLVSRVLWCRWACPGARRALDPGYTESRVHPKGETGTPDPKPTRDSWQAQDPNYTKTPFLL